MMTARFWSKAIVRGQDDCWPWVAAVTHTGYGRINIGGTIKRAHRIAYELVKGPIPEGLELDHLCRNRACINPDHLEPVTHAVNMRRGYSANAAKTHCPQGHEYSDANTYTYSDGRRMCRHCQRDRGRRAIR